MKESIYIHATGKAWSFAWSHKKLWLFGAFAAFLGQFGMVEFLGKLGVDTVGSGGYMVSAGSVLSQIGSFIANAGYSYDSKIVLSFLLALMLAIFAVFIFLAVVSQGLLLYVSAESIKNKNINIVKAWYIGTANFWRLFFLNFFKKIIISLIIIIFSLSAYGVLLTPSIANSIFLTLVVILLALVGLVLSFLFFYSAGYLVIEKESLSVAVQKAWIMFVKHPLVSFEIGLLIVILNLFFGAITAFGFILAILPAILIWFAIAMAGGSFIALTAALIASIIVFTMYLIVAGAGFTVFTTYIWTYAFVEMHDTGLKSKIIHFVNYLRGIKNR